MLALGFTSLFIERNFYQTIDANGVTQASFLLDLGIYLLIFGSILFCAFITKTMLAFMASRK